MLTAQIRVLGPAMVAYVGFLSHAHMGSWTKGVVHHFAEDYYVMPHIAGLGTAIVMPVMNAYVAACYTAKAKNIADIFGKSDGILPETQAMGAAIMYGVREIASAITEASKTNSAIAHDGWAHIIATGTEIATSYTTLRLTSKLLDISDFKVMTFIGTMANAYVLYAEINDFKKNVIVPLQIKEGLSHINATNHLDMAFTEEYHVTLPPYLDNNFSPIAHTPKTIMTRWGELLSIYGADLAMDVVGGVKDPDTPAFKAIKAVVTNALSYTAFAFSDTKSYNSSLQETKALVKATNYTYIGPKKLHHDVINAHWHEATIRDMFTGLHWKECGKATKGMDQDDVDALYYCVKKAVAPKVLGDYNLCVDKARDEIHQCRPISWSQGDVMKTLLIFAKYPVDLVGHETYGEDYVHSNGTRSLQEAIYDVA